MSTITEKVKASTDADIQRLASRVVELEGELQCAQRSRADAMFEIKRLREALETIANHIGNTTGICPYGCDSPYVAEQALSYKSS